MNECLTVYGFGSFFEGGLQPNDIDLLLLHRSTEFESCQFAIDCKARLKAALPLADIVMLSQAEAERISFIEQARALRLAKLRSSAIDADLKLLTERIKIA